MQFSHFEFDPETDRLGEGPLSEVYKAVDLDLGRTVALKILRSHAEIDPQADRRFQREAKHTANIAHPNIAIVYEFGQDHGTSFIAMEYLQGRTLDRIIKDQSLGYEECLRIAREVCDALRVVHESKLIHRDLKPGNILLQDDGSVKLLDFGIARARDEAGITQHGMLVGTVLYMSPEQVRGDELDFRSDVFSLGAVLYHVITGALPFPGESFPEVCMAILEGSPRPPSDVRSGLPKPLEEFLLRCLRADPEDRYRDAADAYGDLATLSDQLSATSARATLKGSLALPPVRCGGDHPEVCHQMAGSVRKDLATELGRNKSLELVLIDGQELPRERNFDYALRMTLSVEGHQGALELETEVFQGNGDARASKIYQDRCVQVDEDEWALQENLVRAAVRTIRKRLTTASTPLSTSAKRQIQEATALARHAHDVLHRSTNRHLMTAIGSFRRALDHDPYCALAYAGLAEAMVRKFLYWDGDPSFLEEAREAADKALILDSACAEAHTALGFANHLAGYREDALREYRAAIQLDNREWLAHRLQGALLAREGNFKHASPLLTRAIGLKSTHIDSYDHLYTVLLRLDRYEEAIEVADRGIAAGKKHLKKTPDDQAARLHVAMLQARLGLHDEAREQVLEARRRAPKDGYTAFHSACVFALMGEPTDALELLQLAQARGYYIKTELVRNTDLDLLRGLPEFQELVS